MKRILMCGCGGRLEFRRSFDGCDWESEEGEGSKNDYEIALVCKECGTVYAIGRTKKMYDLVECKDKCY